MFLGVVVLTYIVSLNAISGRYPIFAAILSIPGFAAFVFYFYFYITHFLQLNDIYTHREYYFDIFRLWGALFFSYLMVLHFSVVASFIDQALGFDIGFKGASEIDMLWHSLKIIIDSVSFGLLTSINFSFTKHNVSIIYGQIYFWIVQVCVDITVITHVIGEIKRRIEISKSINKVLKGDLSLQPAFATMDKHKLRLLTRALKKVEEDKSKILALLRLTVRSRHNDVETLHLKYIQESNDSQIEAHCKKYLESVKSWKYKRLLKNTMKRPGYKKHNKSNGLRL